MIAFIMSRFPKPSETFIEREFLALQKRGLDFIILPLRSKPGKSWIENGESLSSRCHYITNLSSLPAVIKLGLTHLWLWAKLKTKIMWVYRGDFRHGFKLLRDLPKIVRFAELCKEKKVTRIHAHWATNPAMAAWVISQITGIPYSFTAHAYDIFCDPPFLKEKVEGADFVLTCTGHNQKLLKSLAPKGDIRLSYHGLPLDEFSVKTNYPVGPARIFTAARLVSKKGLCYLIEALAILKERGLRAQLSIAGDGPLKEKLERLAQDQGVDGQVEFLGPLPHAKVRERLRVSTMVVLPSVKDPSGNMDGIPNILIEAMACGVPVISTWISGIPELVENGVEGLLVPERDAEALATAIETLSKDVEKQRAMGKAGRAKVENLFDAEKTAAELYGWLASDG